MGRNRAGQGDGRKSVIAGLKSILRLHILIFYFTSPASSLLHAFFSCGDFFLVDDDSGLFAIGSVR